MKNKMNGTDRFLYTMGVHYLMADDTNWAKMKTIHTLRTLKLVRKWNCRQTFWP